MKGVILAWRQNSRLFGKEAYNRRKGELTDHSVNLSVCIYFPSNLIELLT
jgi:hypothetical protein